MSRRFSLAFLSIVFVYGLSIVFAPRPALAVNCDVNTCINICSKGKVGTAIQSCNSWCQITIQERKTKGQCPK
jgi:hypothetical protein